MIKATLQPEDVRRCLEFATQAWERQTQSRRQFGSKDYRTAHNFVQDMSRGKAGELIFCKMLKDLAGVDATPDFNHYPFGTQDDGDIKVAGEPVKWDIKATSHRAQWLLLEEYKLTADIYVLIQIQKQLEAESTLSGELIGWAHSDDFWDSEDSWRFRFRHGDFLLSTDALPDRPEDGVICNQGRILTRLDSPRNVGLPAKWLRTSLGELVERYL